MMHAMTASGEHEEKSSRSWDLGSTVQGRAWAGSSGQNALLGVVGGLLFEVGAVEEHS